MINDAVTRAQIKAAEKKLIALLMEGLNSGPGIPVTDEWRKEQRAQFLAKLPPEYAESVKRKPL